MSRIFFMSMFSSVQIFSQTIHVGLNLPCSSSRQYNVLIPTLFAKSSCEIPRLFRESRIISPNNSLPSILFTPNYPYSGFTDFHKITLRFSTP